MSEESIVYLDEEDVIDYFELDFFNYSQDNCYKNGKIYVISGGGNYAYMNKLRVINLKTNSIVHIIDLSYIPYELERLDFYCNDLVFSTSV